MSISNQSRALACKHCNAIRRVSGMGCNGDGGNVCTGTRRHLSAARIAAVRVYHLLRCNCRHTRAEERCRPSHGRAIVSLFRATKLICCLPPKSFSQSIVRATRCAVRLADQRERVSPVIAGTHGGGGVMMVVDARALAGPQQCAHTHTHMVGKSLAIFGAHTAGLGRLIDQKRARRRFD